MKLTIFTSNHPRHNYLIELLSSSCTELFVIQESKKKINSGSNLFTINKYFENVKKSEIKYFGDNFNFKNKNIYIKKIEANMLSKINLENINNFLKSDLYIVFGSSFIKDDLIEFLIENKAINIHMGISPFYRGSGCNFWAMYDDNPHLVGATIHYISKELDGGDILYHAISNLKNDIYDYPMSTVMSAFESLNYKIKSKKIFKLNTITQDNNKLKRLSKNKDFNEKIVSNFFSKKINLESKSFDLNLFHNPYVYG